MVRRACLSPILGVLMATTSAAFAPAPVYREPSQAKLLDAMQGIWVFDFQAREKDKGTISTVIQRVQIENKTWKSKYITKGVAPDNQQYEIVLDATKNPATLDLVSRRENAPRIEMLGVVKLEGGTLTYFYAQTWEKDATRPRSFDATQRLPNGTRPYAMTLKRLK